MRWRLRSTIFTLALIGLTQRILVSAQEVAESELILDRRMRQERQWRRQWLSLVPHRFNYFLPVTYDSSPNNEAFASLGRPPLKHAEAKFQFSVKVLVWEDIFQNNGHLYFGFTQLSLWQVYQRSNSAPIRDSNYEPEFILTFDTERELGSFMLRRMDVAISHQSNGREAPLSRSWNRIYANFYFERRNMVVSIRPWYRIPDSARFDDNPDIYRYLGYGELAFIYVKKQRMLVATLRNNLRDSDNKGSILVDFTFPLTRNMRGLVQYFNGYGESLLDYNHPSNRIGVGIALSD